MVVQLEDVFGVVEQANLPGTIERASQLAAQASPLRSRIGGATSASRRVCAAIRAQGARQSAAPIRRMPRGIDP